MVEDCSCKIEAMYQLDAFRAEAWRAQAERIQGLTLFKEGISDGAFEVAARHLYYAGLYAASLDNGFTRNPDDWMIMGSLNTRLAGQCESLVSFFMDKQDLVRQQGVLLDVERVLRGTLRRRTGVEGRLAARISAEFRQASEALIRLERLSEKLVSWRENMRLESMVSIKSISDMHE
jgi:hypothetical protein